MLVFDSMQEVTKDFGKKTLKAGVKTVNIVAATARKNAISEAVASFCLSTLGRLKPVHVQLFHASRTFQSPFIIARAYPGREREPVKTICSKNPS